MRLVFWTSSEITRYTCVEVQCLRQCFMRGCKNTCGEKDHFHGQLNESRMFAEENGVTCVLDLSDDSTARRRDEEQQVIHYCDVRRPCRDYYCNKHFGHMGLHATSHGNMCQTYFIAKGNDIDIEDRKYQVGERGIAEMCNLFCAKVGTSTICHAKAKM
ncbi:hypothetical protein F444_21913 [Phytophthora nicotianae P1976]|uniref:Uncharacterized protein n=1 Tax=Phytophthora nicotianae P1976 TaxID=1317066 RepID=A0A080YZH9_PHYNI|nr:hypothetical protein F444_21913 [Phytophthora nicotianae P1976]